LSGLLKTVTFNLVEEIKIDSSKDTFTKVKIVNGFEHGFTFAMGSLLAMLLWGIAIFIISIIISLTVFSQLKNIFSTATPITKTNQIQNPIQYIQPTIRYTQPTIRNTR